MHWYDEETFDADHFSSDVKKPTSLLKRVRDVVSAGVVVRPWL